MFLDSANSTIAKRIVILLLPLLLMASGCVVRKSTVTVVSVQAMGVTGRVLNRNHKPVGGVRLTLLLKKCRCEECPDKKKCDCCPLQQNYTTTENGVFAFDTGPGAYMITAQKGETKVEREVTITRKRQQIKIGLPI